MAARRLHACSVDTLKGKAVNHRICMRARRRVVRLARKHRANAEPDRTPIKSVLVQHLQPRVWVWVFVCRRALSQDQSTGDRGPQNNDPPCFHPPFPSSAQPSSTFSHHLHSSFISLSHIFFLLLQTALLLHFAFLPLFFFFCKILFSSDPPLLLLLSLHPISGPITQTVLFFDASFMVLFPNALSISSSATLSNLHHRLLSSLPAFPFTPSCNVLSSLLAAAAAAASCPFLFPTTQLAHFIPALSTHSFMLPPSLLSPTHSLFHHFHFSLPFLPHSSQPSSSFSVPKETHLLLLLVFPISQAPPFSSVLRLSFPPR